MNKNEICDWQVHVIKNGQKCCLTGVEINDMLPGTANFHTHGMEKYNHPNFQIVLDYDVQQGVRILNVLCLLVSRGARFKDGDCFKKFFMDGDIRFAAFKEAGRDILRVIIPDEYNRFPGEKGCDAGYEVQLFDIEDLYVN